MPDMPGVVLQQKLLDMGRNTPIIFISGESQPSEIIEAMKLGAIDFLLKPFGMEILLSTIEKALDKDRRSQSELVKNLDMKQRFERLTEKEQEICRLIVRGYGNKEISEINGSAPSTVKLHRSRVLEKMGCETLPELIAITFDGKGAQYDFFSVDLS
jgi:FixJ family two-component response regulator